MKNPVLSTSFDQAVEQRKHYGYRSDNPQFMTKSDVISATLMLLSIVAIFGAGVAYVGMNISPSLASLANMVGVGGVLLMGFVNMFSSSLKRGNMLWSMLFCVFEGLMVGGITFTIGHFDVNGVDGWTLVGQAIVGTVGLFFVAMFLYSAQIVKVTAKFRSFLFMATAAMGVLYLVNLGITAFTGTNHLWGTSFLPAIVAAVAIILGSMSIIESLDTVDNMAEAGVDKSYKWALGMSFALDLVWLYIEVLRLLTWFAKR